MSYQTFQNITKKNKTMIKKYMVTTTSDRQIVDGFSVDSAIHNYEKDAHNDDEITGVVLCDATQPPPTVNEEVYVPVIDWKDFKRCFYDYYSLGQQTKEDLADWVRRFLEGYAYPKVEVELNGYSLENMYMLAAYVVDWFARTRYDRDIYTTPKMVADEYLSTLPKPESGEVGIGEGLQLLIDELPHNMPLYKDSGLWQVRSDNMKEVICQQGINESFLDFIKRFLESLPSNH